MKKVALLLSLGLGCASASFAASDMPRGDAAAGEKNAVVCGACHGADGNSMAPFPKLAGQGAKYLYKQLMDIRDGARVIPTMAGQLDGKSDQDLADFAAFFAAQSRTLGKTDADKLELGRKVYRAGVASRGVAACTACHSPTGQGNPAAGYPALSGQHAQYVADQLRAYRQGAEDPAGRTNDGDTKIMRSVASGLSDMEIAAVASYVAGLH